jgi:hypothetical protein
MAAVVLLVAGCGTETRSDTYDALPSDAWPLLEGVRVVSSEGYTGQNCCESHPGGRLIFLAVPGTVEHPREFVESALLGAGWVTERCVRRVTCVEHDGAVAFLYPASRQQLARGIDVTVKLERDPLA